MLILICLVIVCALLFEFVNGFHDTANCIATVVATKALSPGCAIVVAVVMNLLGALTGTAVALTIAAGILNRDIIVLTPQIVLCALIGGIVWNLITWKKGLPSSSSHSLIGGLCGVGLAASNGNWKAVIWSQDSGTWTQNQGLLWKVVVPMMTSPLAGFVLSIVVMVLLWAVLVLMVKSGGRLQRLTRPLRVNAFFAKAQIISAAYMGFAHGQNDAQKTMGIIAMTLTADTAIDALDHVPSWLFFLRASPLNGDTIAPWIMIACAVVMAAGTALGGWKIIKTMGHKMVKLQPIHGFAVETSSATILTVAAQFGMPVSTTHSISTAIIGVGFAKNPRLLRYHVIERIIWAWILTIPAAAGVAYLAYRILALLTWV